MQVVCQDDQLVVATGKLDGKTAAFVELSRHRLTRALAQIRQYGPAGEDKANERCLRLMRYVAHVAYCDLRDLGLGAEAKYAVAKSEHTTAVAS